MSRLSPFNQTLANALAPAGHAGKCSAAELRKPQYLGSSDKLATEIQSQKSADSFSTNSSSAYDVARMNSFSSLDNSPPRSALSKIARNKGKGLVLIAQASLWGSLQGRP